MIPIPSGVRVWIATGHTDMRRGTQSLALTVQESLKRRPRRRNFPAPKLEREGHFSGGLRQNWRKPHR